MPKAHDKLFPPSGAKRWIQCALSVSMAAQMPPQGGTAYTEEGTVAHSAAEAKLLLAAGEISKTEYNKRMKKIQKSEFWSGEMDEAATFYAEHVREIIAERGEDLAELMVEQHFKLDPWIPDGFGTADAVVIGEGVLEVIDFKFGKGVKVDAPENPQLRLYGAGAALLFGDLYEVNTVRMTIIQPRLDHISTEELPLMDLFAWCETVVKPAVELAKRPDPPAAAGDWCRWCPAKAVCRTRAEANLELAKYDFYDPNLLTPAEIGEILGKIDQLTKWASDVQTYALQQALAGEHFDGWKLVEGRAVRKYADDLKVADALTAAGYDEAALYERKLYGITAMEKIVGKKKLTEILGELIVRPAGKPVLVPESDKREAINTTEAAKTDFAEELPF